MIERTTVRLPRDLLSRAKRKALAERRTLTSLIEEGLRLVVSERKPAKRERRPLPFSTAGGQLDVITRPGAGTTMRITLHSSRGRSRVEPAA